ncbi:hypothetical protein AAFF_G00393240 [Aldrovandia affinis]|uniref:Uncharacterized protein n=1 Tax=Aldrovandia affinis TaxID=143900 RepID=A0AAD7SDH3_9TELE|nr:hypothetical protein AAFF_G00393240 [Aldrovandia affinis]
MSFTLHVYIGSELMGSTAPAKQEETNLKVRAAVYQASMHCCSGREGTTAPTFPSTSGDGGNWWLALLSSRAKPSPSVSSQNTGTP